MTDFKLSQRSLDNLEGVHPDLVGVVKRAIELTQIDFGVVEGLRDQERQMELVASGASTTMNSRHLTGHAVDLMAYWQGKGSWHWPHYHKIYAAMSMAAAEQGVDMKWGGHWKGFPDGPHFELSRDKYPA